MTTSRFVRHGEQLFNSYGDVSNERLLLQCVLTQCCTSMGVLGHAHWREAGPFLTAFQNFLAKWTICVL